jgi:hypothetical protein
MASITITSPQPDSQVTLTFTANGTYGPPNPVPTVTVVLLDSAGTIVATGTVTQCGSGSWTATIAAQQAYTGASVEASFTGADDSVTNITVQ